MDEKKKQDFLIENTETNKQEIVEEVLSVQGDKKGKNKVKKNKKKQKQPVINRFAKAFFVVGLVLGLLSLLPVVSIFFLIAYLLILIVIAMITLFSIFFNPTFKEHFESVLLFGNMFSSLTEYIPYVLFGSGFFFGLTALLSLLSKKKKEKKLLIIFSFIFMAITCILATILIAFEIK